MLLTASSTFLSASFICISWDHFFLSPDFHEVWRSVRSIRLLQKLSGNGLCQYWDGRPPQCTARGSDGFVIHASRPKPLSALFTQHLHLN